MNLKTKLLCILVIVSWIGTLTMCDRVFHEDHYDAIDKPDVRIGVHAVGWPVFTG